MNAPKCANCNQPHSAAYKQCTKYLEVKHMLRAKASQKPQRSGNMPLFSDVLKRGLITSQDVDTPDQRPVQMTKTNSEISECNSFSQMNTHHDEDQIVNKFLDFDRDYYRDVVRSEPLIPPENQMIPLNRVITFVQGIVAMFDKGNTLSEMRSLLVELANQYLFGGRCSFSYNVQ